MAKVIKHFEGFGTSTPYTVPTGKIAQIQGSFTFKSTSAGLVSPSFTFSTTEVFFDVNNHTGIHWILNADSAWIVPFGGTGGSSASTTSSVRFLVGTNTPDSDTTGRSGMNFAGGNLSASNHNMTNGTGSTYSPAPRIYLSAGDSLSFTAVTSSSVGYNFIAIEEDA